MENIAVWPGSGERHLRLRKPPSDDRRAKARYPLGLDLRYTVLNRHQAPPTGSGRIVDLSSSGLRFGADRPLELGYKVELTINWPLLLEGSVRLRLVALGKVVWVQGKEAALLIERYEFRTCGAAPRATYNIAVPVLRAQSATAHGLVG